MTFTGTMIEDLITTVERAERRQSDGTMLADSLLLEPWFASVQKNADYDSKLLGVA